MYELISHAVAEPRLREVRRRALPSMQRRREHDRELRLVRDVRSSAADPVTPVEAVSRWSPARLAAALRRRGGLAVDAS